MIKSTILLFVFIYPSVIRSQPSPEELQFSYQIESMIAHQEMRTTTASSFYTFIGDYLNAISTDDIPVSWGVDTLDFSDMQTALAIEEIIAKAKDQRIIIISESHQKPQHRIFAKELVDSLHIYGFDHLGLEDLRTNMKSENQAWDSSLQQRGYPLMVGTGYYAREPHMADLIRSSLRHGMTLFAYENDLVGTSKDRDEVQADNVISYMQKSGASKVILLCGFHHANESEDIKRRHAHWMARYIKDKTGIDPFTIYQDNFTEKIKSNQHPYLENCGITAPSVFIDSLGDLARLSRQVDVEVLHPITRFMNGRPSWLFQNKDYKEYFFEGIRDDASFPLLVMAFSSGEEKDGVPMDIFEMKDRYDRKSFVLPPGAYIIRVLSEDKVNDSKITIDR